MKPKIKTNSNRLVRHYRIRKRVIGTSERPRLCLSPSLKHMEAQFIDDFEKKTLIGVSSKAKDFKKAVGLASAGNVDTAVKFGKFAAQTALSKGIKKVVFDRGGYLYHGRVKAFADAAREQGLSF